MLLLLFLEDSDFVAKGSGSEDDLEFDSDAKIDSDDDDSVKGDSEGDEEERASKKRKKEHTSSSQPKKRKKVGKHAENDCSTFRITDSCSDRLH